MSDFRYTLFSLQKCTVVQNRSATVFDCRYLYNILTDLYGFWPLVLTICADFIFTNITTYNDARPSETNPFFAHENQPKQFGTVTWRGLVV